MADQGYLLRLKAITAHAKAVVADLEAVTAAFEDAMKAVEAEPPAPVIAEVSKPAPTTVTINKHPHPTQRLRTMGGYSEVCMNDDCDFSRDVEE